MEVPVKFAIKNENDTFRLFLREGSVDYIITDKARKIAFHTPEGVYSVAEIVFNAATSPVVRGTVQVNKEGKTEISVTEGKLIFATADGMKAVGANEKIVLAIAEVGVGAGAGAGAGATGTVGTILGMSPFALGAGLAGVAALTTTVIVNNNNNNNNNNPVLPATPSPSF